MYALTRYQEFDHSGIGINMTNKSKLPQQFALKPNYPNPFNSSTTITFELSRNSNIKLSIVNIQGKHIKTLINGKLESGSYQYTWDGTDNSRNNLSSGIYICILQAESYQSYQKMILTK